MFNILVVDDQAHIRRLYEYTLEKNGYQPYTAGDGEQALKLMETTHIDLVILDLMMPTMDGYTFLKTMRSDGSNIPVLIITARDSAEDIRKSFTGDFGFLSFMCAPVLPPCSQARVPLQAQYPRCPSAFRAAGLCARQPFARPCRSPCPIFRP